MKKGLIFTVMLVSVLALGYTQNASWTVNNVTTWIEAVGAIRSGGNNKEYTITVTGNISVPSSTENTFGSVDGVRITLQGNGTLIPSANGSLLYVGAGQTIIARDLTLRGRNANNDSVVKIVNGGTFRMEGRATVTGNSSSKYSGAGVYVVRGGVFTMRDNATVSGNQVANNYSRAYGSLENGGGGVYIEGTFIMEGGTITGNSASGGGGVYVKEQGTFTMQGGTITGNSANDGGGVCLFRWGKFNMQGGTITGNSAEMDRNYGDPGGAGGGVCSYHSDSFSMQGGTISNNTAEYGGGVYSNSGYTFTMQGGTISNNTATYGGGVYSINSFTMQGGTVSNNTATYGGGVYSYSDFTMQGGTISNNTATYGGGIYNDKTFTMQSNASISGNTAIYYGGGVYDRGTIIKSGGTIYGDDAEQNLKNTVNSRLGHVVYNEQNSAWRNTTAGQTMNSDSYGFWLNDGDVTIFPSNFTTSGYPTTWKRSNFNNTLSITRNTIKSSSSNYLWVLQRISGNAYTFKRSDATNTLTLTIRLDGNSLVISGDNGNGQDNWNGTWAKQR